MFVIIVQLCALCIWLSQFIALMGNVVQRLVILMVDITMINVNLLQFVIKLFIAYLDYVMGCNHPLILCHDAFKLFNLINEMLLLLMCFYVLTCIAQNHAFVTQIVFFKILIYLAYSISYLWTIEFNIKFLKIYPMSYHASHSLQI